MNVIIRSLLFLCICLPILTGIAGIHPIPAFAESAIKLQVNPGIGGEYKEVELIPLQVTITNSGDDMEGTLVLEAKRGNESAATYYQPVSIGKGSTKKVTLMVPGFNLLPSDVVTFQQGETELARASIGGRRVDPDTLIVGVLATDPDTANFLATLPRKSFSAVRVISMNPEEITTSQGLQMVDILLLNNFSADRLNAEQIEAIKSWTKQGGTLLLAGGAHYSKAASQFADLSPVTVEGTAAVTSLTSLQQVNKEKAIALEQPFTLSRATVKSGKVLYQEGNIPLFVLGNANKGNVLYAAYDLTEEPLASWSGNSDLWAQLLPQVVDRSKLREDMDFHYRYYQLTNASEAFPSLQPPNFLTLAVAFAGYALFVGPILFLIFRSKKARGYIWGVAPGVAILGCLSIYLYGYIERGPDVKLANISYINLDRSGQAEVTSATSIFVPSGGDYEVRIKNSDSVLPVRRDYRGDSEERVGDTWVNAAANQAAVQFKGVEHWSIRSLITKRTIPDIGQIESNLVYENGKLVGTITNKTKFSLRDVKLINERNVQDVGTLAAGESVQVSITNDFASMNVNRDNAPARQNLLPNGIKSEKEYRRSREFRMLQFIDRDEPINADYWQYPVKILGWAEQPVVEAEVVGEKSGNTDLTLITSDLEVKPGANGYVFYPAGTFDARRIADSGEIEEDGGGYHVAQGEITFDFALQKENLKIDKIYLFTWSYDRAFLDKQVFNWNTQTFEPYDKVFQGQTLSGDKLVQYLSPEKTLRIKFINSSTDHKHLGEPAIGVEGWVVNK